MTKEKIGFTDLKFSLKIPIITSWIYTILWTFTLILFVLIITGVLD